MCALRPPSAGRLADMALAFHPQISPKAEVPLSPPQGEGQQARSPATLSKLETRRAGRRGAHLPLQASEPTSCPQGWAALSTGGGWGGRKITKELWPPLRGRVAWEGHTPAGSRPQECGMCLSQLGFCVTRSGAAALSRYLTQQHKGQASRGLSEPSSPE